MAEKKYVIGIDFGTDSVRSIIVDTENGQELASSVFEYPRWKQGKYCIPEENQFRQHPLDYLEGLEKTIKEAIGQLPQGQENIIAAISIGTTGSTPVAVDSNGTPLALLPGFEENPNAMFILWKDHTAIKEANEINALAHKWEIDYTKYEGGVYSSEWFWAKILHIIREDENVRSAAFSWVEHCDWIPALLTGAANPKNWKRSRCAAGHKAMWHNDFNGLPSEDFLVKIDSKLKGIRERLYSNTYTCEISAGNLSHEWSEKLGLSTNVLVGVGSFDAHMGALGGEIAPFHLSKIIGTSTCDMLIAPMEKLNNKAIAGICGQVEGSIVPGMLGLEAGQSAFGDIYAWFKKVLIWPVENLFASSLVIDEKTKAQLKNEIADNLIAELSKQATLIPVQETSEIALDWMNGRRTPYAN
ncbi:MAG: ribulokinase, partial [Bacteroidales bacterium]|nr:ribulokinase [Bacteroidales bacterium]